MSNSPHLPEKQKSEVERKRRVLKDQVEMTLKFETQNTGPLNDVLYQINREGDQYRDIFTERELDLDKNSVLEKKINSEFFDCSDNVFCSDF